MKERGQLYQLTFFPKLVNLCMFFSATTLRSIAKGEIGFENLQAVHAVEKERSSEE